MQDRVHEMVTGKKKEPEKTAAEKQAEQLAKILETVGEKLSGVGAKQGAAAWQQPWIPKYKKNGKRLPPPMAPLPPHLLPKGLGGEGGEDLQIGDEHGNKKNQLSTFKRIKNRDQLEKEAERQEQDAQFLDELFNDNLSQDTRHQEEVREQQYNNIRNEINKD